jgi:hypothetical protein
MMRAALLACLLVSSAWAHDPGDSGISVEYADGSIIEPNTTTLAIDGATLATSIDGSGRVVLTTGPLVTLLGQQIGDTAAEFASTVVFDGRTIDFDAVTDLMWPDPLILDTTNVGGTATTSVLKLNPSSNASYAAGATIELCEGAPSASGSVNCMTVAPDGVSLSTNATIFSGLQAAFTATQTTDALIAGSFPSVFGLNFSPGLTITNSSIGGTGLGAIVGVISSPSVTNGTNDNYSGATSVSYAGGFTSSRTSTGTLGITKANVFQSQITAPNTSITYTDARDFQALEISGTVNGAVTRHTGFVAEAMTKGTTVMPFAAGEATITGTPPTGYGAWGVESGAPNRLWFQNESGHIWRTGWATWSMSSALLGADNGTDYFRPVGFAQAAGTTEATVDEPTAPGPMKVYGISCNARVAPANGGGTQSRTCTLRVGTPGSLAASALTCSFTEATQSCTDREEAGVAVGATQVATIEWTAASTPADSEVATTLWWNLDAF